MSIANGARLAILTASVCASIAYGSDSVPPKTTGPIPGPEILGLRVGKDSLHDAVLKLGPPKALYLAGEDAEFPDPKSSDPLVLRYERSFELTKSYPASILLFFAPETYKLQVATVTFEDPEKLEPVPVWKQEIEKTYGTKYRLAHRRIILDSDEISGNLSDCDDPGGSIEDLIYQERGLEVFLEPKEGKPTVIEVRFSEGIWSGKEKLDLCSKKQSGKRAKP